MRRNTMLPEDPDVDRLWWIGEGTEHCAFCLQGYAVEVETRCVACDRPGCMHCVTKVRIEESNQFLCTGCTAEAASQRGAGEGG